MKSKRPTPKQKTVPANPYDWLVEPIAGDPTYFERSMFGCRACYIRGRMVFLMARGGTEPWNGILVPTDRCHHATLTVQYIGLTPHPVLGKWLYLSESHDQFEEMARALVELVRKGDLRIGIEPKPRRKLGSAGTKPRPSQKEFDI